MLYELSVLNGQKFKVVSSSSNKLRIDVHLVFKLSAYLAIQPGYEVSHRVLKLIRIYFDIRLYTQLLVGSFA